MPVARTAREEAIEKAGLIRDKALESLSGGLAQMKHVRHQLKDGVGPKAKELLDHHISNVTALVEGLAELDLSQ